MNTRVKSTQNYSLRADPYARENYQLDEKKKKRRKSSSNKATFFLTHLRENASLVKKGWKLIFLTPTPTNISAKQENLLNRQIYTPLQHVRTLKRLHFGWFIFSSTKIFIAVVFFTSSINLPNEYLYGETAYDISNEFLKRQKCEKLYEIQHTQRARTSAWKNIRRLKKIIPSLSLFVKRTRSLCSILRIKKSANLSNLAKSPK